MVVALTRAPGFASSDLGVACRPGFKVVADALLFDRRIVEHGFVFEVFSAVADTLFDELVGGGVWVGRGG